MAYADETAARIALKHLRYRYGVGRILGLSLYKCAFCGHYHLGHTPSHTRRLMLAA